MIPAKDLKVTHGMNETVNSVFIYDNTEELLYCYKYHKPISFVMINNYKYYGMI